MAGENNTYYKDNLIVLYHKDCKDMPELADNSIDLIVTDPPYGYSFMGKDWDKAVIPVDIWKECLRVLKPGAFAFVMCSPRQDCLGKIVCNLSDAGFETGFTSLYHAYASGFPKAQNCAKVILKRFLQVSLQGVSHSPHINEDSQPDYLIHCHLCGGLLQSGQVIFRDASPLQGDVLKCNHLSSPLIDIQVDNEHKHKASYASLSFHHATQDLKPLESWQTIVSSVLESKPDDWLPQFSADNWGLADKFPLPHDFGQRDSTSGNNNGEYENEIDVQPKLDKSGMADGNTHKSTQSHLYYTRYCPDCQRQMSKEYSGLNGSYAGMQVKPAVEVILVVMKPLNEKTFVDQALKNRKGISWLDDGRIPITNLEGEPGYRPNQSSHKFHYDESSFSLHKSKETRAGKDGDFFDHRGRFPANLLVSDDVLNDGRITGAGITGGGYVKPHTQGVDTCFVKEGMQITGSSTADSGSFSRYFDLDKWAQKTFPFLIVPKASKGEKNKGLSGREEQTVSDGRQKSIDNPFQRGETPRKNIHPTCKPLKLMSYLITLGSREGDTILDPFVGSGTTCLAAKLLNRKSIGYELEEQYCEIAVARCRQMILEM